MKTLKQLKRLKKNQNRDIFSLKQAQARKESNLNRQAQLAKERTAALGNPVHGVETPFIKSLDSAVPPPPTLSVTPISGDAPSLAEPSEPPDHLSHSLSDAEVQRSLTYSRNLSEPTPVPDPRTGEILWQPYDRSYARWKSHDARASSAFSRILTLANGSSLQRTKRNIARIISTFGRHNTDSSLRPKNPSFNPPPSPAKIAAGVVANPEPRPRAGPDTGSSEVQIGILTTKIRLLAQRYETWGKQDKANKRNLRLLLHRRQKLLKYMEKRERGSERWSHLLETLGLTEGTWKGQIEVR